MKMVADIFIDSGEFGATETLLIDTRYLYMTDKSCRVVFDEIRAAVQQKRINTNNHAERNPTQEDPPTEPKVMLVVEKEKTRTNTEQQTQRTTKRTQIVRCWRGTEGI